MKFTFETEDLHQVRQILSALAPSVPLVQLMKEISDESKPPNPGHRSDRHQLQGSYMAYLQHLSPSNAKQVKAEYKRRGVQSAVALARTLIATQEGNSTARLGRHRVKCQWCKRGFLALQKRSRFCSKRCRDTEYRHRHPKSPEAPAPTE